MQTELGAGIVSRITRALPARRWQAAYWLGKLLVPDRPFVGSFRGGRLEVHPDEMASMVCLFYGFYEREVTIWCLDLLRQSPPELVVDVGANFGYYPLLFGLVSRGKTRSIAFEPDPVNFAWLSRNLALNPTLDITAVPLAVGAAVGAVSFETARPGRNLWARVGDGQGPNEHREQVVTVPSTSLDAYLDAHGIGAVPLTLIDVEGHEAEVVRGMASGIASGRYERVIVEFHPWAYPAPEAALTALARSFTAAGYTGHRFQRYLSPAPDRDPRFFRLRERHGVLGPLRFDALSSWEHFLFQRPTAAEPAQ